MLTSAQKQRYSTRNHRIILQVLQGRSFAEAGEMNDCSKSAVENVVRRNGGMDVLMEKYKNELEKPVEGKLVPLIDETDLLNSGLIAANNRLTKAFIKIALELSDDELHSLHGTQKLTWLSILSPMVKNQIRELKPTNVNFFIGQGNSEDLERKLLEYATGRSIKPDIPTEDTRLKKNRES